MVRVALLVAACVASGCGANLPYAADCTWPAHESRPLDLSAAADARHLSDDALTAEDVAIRHADLGQARARHSIDPGPYRERREACKAKLFAAISDQHRVSLDAVAGAVGRRRRWLDALVMLAFGGIYVTVARLVARRIFRGALADSLVVAAGVSLVTAAALALVGLLAGEVWSMLIEGLRVGNGHMSYRADRVPWRQYPIPLFVTGVALFMIVAAASWNAHRARIAR